MSDSSDDEDISRFREVVDTSFIKFINTSKTQTTKETEITVEKPKSQRYLVEASHYNDVKIPEQMQNKIWSKVSAVIQKNVEFVEGELDTRPKKHKIKGGVKLFKNSNGFLSCAEIKDTYTENHNKESKNINRNMRRKFDADDENINEHDKIMAASISGDYILSNEDTRHWKSRKKEKLFKYRGKKNSKVLTLVE